MEHFPSYLNSIEINFDNELFFNFFLQLVKHLMVLGEENIIFFYITPENIRFHQSGDTFIFYLDDFSYALHKNSIENLNWMEEVFYSKDYSAPECDPSFPQYPNLICEKSDLYSLGKSILNFLKSFNTFDLPQSFQEILCNITHQDCSQRMDLHEIYSLILSQKEFVPPQKSTHKFSFKFDEISQDLVPQKEESNQQAQIITHQQIDQEIKIERNEISIVKNNSSEESNKREDKTSNIQQSILEFSKTNYSDENYINERNKQNKLSIQQLLGTLNLEDN